MHYGQIEGMLLSRGQDPLDFNLRQIISITEAWFLGHYDPWSWTEVLEKLESMIETHSVFDADGKAIPPSNRQMDELAELLALAQQSGEDEQPTGAEEPSPERLD